MRRFLFLCIATAAILFSRGGAGQNAQQTKPSQLPLPPPRFFQNDRLKRTVHEDLPIPDADTYPFVSGMWIPESKDPAKALILPEQVSLTCNRDRWTCQELKVVLGPVGGMVLIEDPDETIWQLNTWDEKGLIASYGPDKYGPVSERCHRHILSMSFRSGTVSTSDIPTHEKGCEMFPDTDSYKLVRGQYYVDTTPGNDVEKPVEPVNPAKPQLPK